MKINACLTCGEPTKNIKFCSKKCSASRYIKRHNLICQSCKKPFTHNNMYDIKRGKMKFCSETCKARKYSLNESYFSGELTNEKKITLGQIVTIGQIVEFRFIKMFSDLKTLEDINTKLGSSYKIKKSDKGLYRLDILSEKMVLDLIELGVVNKPLYQDIPQDDLWEGIKKTHCYYIADDGVNVFRTSRSKIALWVRDKFSGKMDCVTGKDMYKGVMGCEWVVVWK